MTPSYDLNAENVGRQADEIQARVGRLVAGLTASQLNWQPEGGRRWSIGQCLDHVTKAAEVYSAAIAAAVDASAPPARARTRPNVLGRAFIWFIEPPPRFKTRAQDTAQPASTFELAAVRAEFERGVSALQALAGRAIASNAGDARFANPFAGGRRLFNVTTGIMVMLAHARRHLLQAEVVKTHRDFPSA